MADLSFYSNPDLADGFGSTANGRANAHRGLDFPMAAGTTIPAIRGGTVVINEWSDGLGWCLEISGDDGRFYGYRHMQSDSPLGVGARVEQGSTVGAVGSTGSLAQGSHLCTTNASGEGGVRGIPALVSDPWPYIQSAMNGESVAASTAVQAAGSSLSDVLWSGEDWSYCDPHGQVAADIQYNLSRLGFYNRDDGSDRPADGDFADFSRMGVQRVLADSGVFAGDIDGKIWRGGSYGVQQFADAWGSYTARGGVIDGAPRLLSWTCFSDGLGAYVASKQAPAPAVPAPVIEAPVTVEPTPEPVVEPVAEPEPTPAPAVEPATPQPATPETFRHINLGDVMTQPVDLTESEQSEMLSTAKTISSFNLGAVIPSVKGRKIAYATFGVLGLAVGNTAVAFSAAQLPMPVWLVMALAVVGNLSPVFSTLAIANVTKK